MSEKFLKIGTVCSGIGSPEMALENLGINHEISFACEVDKYPRMSYLENFKPLKILHDMTEESWEEEELYSDLFIGGIPCQSFSLAGKRLGELDKRGLLFYDFYRYVKNQKPKYFIIENVKGLLSDNDGNTFQNWKNLLGGSENGTPFFFPHEDSLMYNLHWNVLNTKDFGLPQNRERVFLIGIREDLPNDFNFPAKQPLKIRLKNILEPEVDEKYFLSETMVKGFIRHAERHAEKGNGFKFETKNLNDIANTITTTEGSMGYNNFIDCAPELVEVGKLQGSYDSEGRVYDVNGVSRTIKNGGGGASKTGYYLVEDVKVIGFERTEEAKAKRKESLKKGIDKGSFSDRKLKVKYQDFSDTILANPNHQKEGLICVKEKNNKRYRIRKLTPLECFRLQGYSDEFFFNCKKVNSDSQLYKQAGNTISVNVIQAILNNLLKEYKK